MSAKHSYTTADYLSWDVAMNLIRKLYKDGEYRMSLLVGCGCFFGLRISDILTLRWEQILNKESFIVIEKKTGKRREIKINKGFAEHIQDCYSALKITNDNRECFVNRFGGILTIQWVNHFFKKMRIKYKLQISNCSTHTLRKTWARRIWENENAEGRGELALIKLSELMNHSSPSITRRYIGLRQQELGEVYDALQF